MGTEVTEEANTAIEDALTRSSLAEGAGLRVWRTFVGGRPVLMSALVEGPTPVDVRLPSDGGAIFVDPSALELLEGKVIDLERNDDVVALVVTDPEPSA